MRKRPKLKNREIGGAFAYYLVIIRGFDWEDMLQTWKACEPYQIEEIAYKGLATRKRDPGAWHSLISP